MATTKKSISKSEDQFNDVNAKIDKATLEITEVISDFSNQVANQFNITNKNIAKLQQDSSETKKNIAKLQQNYGKLDPIIFKLQIDTSTIKEQYIKIQKDINCIIDQLDALFKKQEIDDDERLVIGYRLDRIDKWVHEMANEIGYKLKV